MGLDKTWSYLHEFILEHGPFVGIIGFSQGAALAALLASALESPEHAPAELGVEELRRSVGQEAVKFVVAYSGFRVKGEDWGYKGEEGIRTPVLNFVGALDTVVDEGRTRELVEACVGKREVVHPGGHFVPAGKQWVSVVCGFVESAVKGTLNGKEEEEEEDAADMDVPF